MTFHWDNRLVTFSDGLYRSLLLIYPRSYRDEYGPPMAQLFRDQCRDAWSQSRAWGLLALWLRAVPDLIKTSVLEHIANWKGRKSMADNISALGQSRTKFVVFLGVAAAVFLLTFVTAALVTFILPETFSSMARIKIEPDPQSAAGKNGSYDPYMVQTEFEVIQSEPVLTRVVEKMDLTTEWGKRYAGGEKLRNTEAVALLRQRIELRPIRNTNLLEIHAFSENPKEAADIANNVAEAYRNHRLEQGRAIVQRGIDAMNQSLKEQDDKVRNAQAEVDKLRKELKIPDLDAKGDSPIPALDAEVVRRLQGELVSYETLLAEKRSQFKLFAQLSPDQQREAMQVAIGVDPEFGTLVKEANQADSQLLLLEKEFSTNHPTYLSAATLSKQARTRVDARMQGVLTGLSNRVSQLEAARDVARKNLDEARTSDFAKVELTRPYYDAKARLHEVEDFNRVLRTKLSSSWVDANLPKSMLTEIIDRAQPGIRPVRPNKPMNLFIGACAGIILALVIGGGAAWVVSVLGRKSKGPPPAAA